MPDDIKPRGILGPDGQPVAEARHPIQMEAQRLIIGMAGDKAPNFMQEHARMHAWAVENDDDVTDTQRSVLECVRIVASFQAESIRFVEEWRRRERETRFGAANGDEGWDANGSPVG